MGKLRKTVLILLVLGMATMIACAGKETGEQKGVKSEPSVTEAVVPTTEPMETKAPTAKPTATTKPTATPVPEKKITEMENLSTMSPDGNTQVKIWVDEDGFWSYSVTDRDNKIIDMSRLGMVMQEGNLFRGLTLVEDSVETKEMKETYELFTGYNEFMENHCNVTSFVLKNDQGSFRLELRVHNDGFAYRYLDVTTGDTERVTVLMEKSEVALPMNIRVWSFGLNGTYEGTYEKRDYSGLRNLSQKLCTPVLVKIGESWMLLTEAGALNNDGQYCTSALQTKSGSVTLNWCFGLRRDPARESKGEVDSPGHLDIKTLETVNGFDTPWRVAVIADDLNELINTSLISDLNPPADEELFADTSYIKPGKVAWSWWAEGSYTGVYNKHIEYIDFAAENGWDHICMDADWRNFEHRLAEICEYAKNKGVGVFVWVNYRDLKDKDAMETLVGKWAEAGVVGLKTDYFESDEPSVLQVMQNVAECCARNRLMVLYHGCVRPGGECRTYPNILSTEAVLGEEFHKWSDAPTLANCMMYPFTRNICGSMDYTPVGTKVDAESTHGFGLAQTIVYESALQHFAYAAAAYKNYNGLALLNHIPTTWDETRLIDGFPGEYVTMARRNGENWFVGSMTEEPRTVEFSLDFLGEGSYNAYIYENRPDGTGLVLRELAVTKEESIVLELIKGGGAAMMITKETIDTTVGVTEPIVEDGYVFYEAESFDNLISGAAGRAGASFCSGGQKVGYVGHAGNNLTFTNITVEQTGTYNLLLYYCSGENRNVTLTVNGDKQYVLEKLNSGDFSRPAGIEVQIELMAGVNTIEISNPTAYAPDIDRIGISDSATE